MANRSARCRACTGSTPSALTSGFVPRLARLLAGRRHRPRGHSDACPVCRTRLVDAARAEDPGDGSPVMGSDIQGVGVVLSPGNSVY